MEKLRNKLKEQSGFTLVEMLIVVAIIAILIAISIPLVNSALEKARDATDQANERAAKAEALLVYMGVVEVTDLKDSGGTDAYTSGKAFTAYYDADKGELKAASKKSEIKAYGQCTKGDCYTSIVKSETSTHVGKIIKIVIDDDGTVKTDDSAWEAAS